MELLYQLLCLMITPEKVVRILRPNGGLGITIIIVGGWEGTKERLVVQPLRCGVVGIQMLWYAEA